MYPTRHRPVNRIAVATVAVVAAFALGACSGSGADDGHPAAATGPTTAGPATSTAPSTAGTAVAARVNGAEVSAYAEPGGTDPTMTLSDTTEFGLHRTFLVLAVDGDWLQVLLPVRPNGSTGWLRAADVTLRSIDDLLRVDLDARTLTWVRDGAIVLETPVAIGSDDAPTPTGLFSVTDLLDTGDGDSAYGPFALGLSGHSDVLSEFGGGDGQIGIHGTSDPSSIGEAVSHGCVRVPNDVITRLADELPLGTPVTIA